MNVPEDTGGGGKEERISNFSKKRFLYFQKRYPFAAIAAYESEQGRSITTSRPPDSTPIISIDTTTARVPFDQHKASA